MKRLTHSLIISAFLSVFPLVGLAQSSNDPAHGAAFVLPQVRAGEVYQQSLLQVLRDKYNVSIAGGSNRPAFKWLLIGRLPVGLILDPAGDISGIPESAQDAPYRFRAQVLDTRTPDAEPLEIAFSLKVLPARVRLVNNNSLRLVPSGRTGRRVRADRQDRVEIASASATPHNFSFAGTGADTADSNFAASAANASVEASQNNANSDCHEIEIISVSRPKKDDLAIEIIVSDKAVTALDIFVRSTEGTSNPKRVSVTQPGGTAQATIDEEVRLKVGDNIISVVGLDSKNKTVACGEKTISFTGTPSPAVSSSSVAEIPPGAIPPSGPISLTLTPTVAKKSDAKSGNFKLPDFNLKTLLYGEHGKDVREVYVRVLDGGGNITDEGPKSIKNLKADESGRRLVGDVPVRLGPGHNTITVLAIGADKKAMGEDTIVVTCEEKDCVANVDEGSPALSIERPFAVSNQPDTPVRVTVIQPEVSKDLTGEAKAKREKEVKRLKIKEIYYQVRNIDGEVFAHDAVPVNDNVKVQPVIVDLREGENTVTFFGRDGLGQKITLDSLTRIECRNCTGPSIKPSGNSIYTRAIVGIEQVGGSATDSTQKPFLDLFFGAPLGKDFGGPPPLVQLWGNARIASFPLEADPTNGFMTASALASGFTSTISGLKINKVAQGFDFLAGVDIRLIPQNEKSYFSLIPGTRQRSSVSLIASFGAITPLSASTNQVQLLAKIPTTTTGEIDPAFLELFPEAAGKTNIAFVTPARDRFYRQYYGGVRVKTFFFDKHDRPINQFPAIFDFSFGQNELVTGSLRNVVRFEGFYPFPIREASFFYLYGTALMKVGRGGGKVDLPLFLRPADATASPADLTTLVVPVDKNPVLRSSRDSYRIGVGINLIELLNKLRTPAPAN